LTESASSHEGDHRYRASLRVFSEALGLAELCESLGDPTRGRDIGDPVSSRPGARTWTSAGWWLESGVDEFRPLDEHIAALVEAFEARRDEFESVREACVFDIFCGVFAGDAQGGFAFRSPLLVRLAELQLPVIVDLYSDVVR
jgi:hypothetical protein